MKQYYCIFQESGEGKTSSDSRDNEIKKWQLAPLRKLSQPHLPRRSSEEKSEKIAKESTALASTGERVARSGRETAGDYVLVFTITEGWYILGIL
jgi:hypothetical protein